MTITIQGIRYPMRLTMGAMLRFKRETGKEVSEIGSDLSLLITLMWCAVQSASAADGVEFDLPLLRFADLIGMEQVTAFTESLNTIQTPSGHSSDTTTGDDGKKKL